MNKLPAFTFHHPEDVDRAAEVPGFFHPRQNWKSGKVFFLAAACLLWLVTEAPGSPDSSLPPAKPAFAGADSIPRDSAAGLESATSKKDSLLESLRRSETNPPLELTYKKPDSIISVRNISYTLIVIALLILFLHFLRKFVQRPAGGSYMGENFRMLQQFHLGPKKSIALVKIFDRLLLLGITDSSITTLLEISDMAEVERLLTRLKDTGNGQSANFREIYQGLVSRIKK